MAGSDDAWRGGRPPEDPEKTKRWGFVTAKPSEYLIHMRGGRIRPRSTGQGASCFKWPWDSVAIIPTTINRLQFVADQVTLEKVGVRVSGLAVYRIVQPEIAFRMLNFSYGERASEKLADILREMFVGATRRHVANLAVQDVMTRRKEAIAGELLAELAPVLAGRGRIEDQTPMGWGVVLDTVEIQDVRVLSDEVFANMQAMYRAELATQARTAQLTHGRELSAREAEHEIARLQAQAEIEAERGRREEQTRRGEIEREARLVEAERELVLARHEHERRADELAAERRALTAQAEATLREAQSETDARLRERELMLTRASGELDAELARLHKQIEDSISESRIRFELVARTMPKIAEALGQPIGKLNVTQIGTSVDPSAIVTRGLAGIVELSRALGFAAPTEDPPSDPR